MTTVMVPLGDIEIRPGFNARLNMGTEDGSLDGLVASVKDRGILQPVIVYPSNTPGRYVLVAGHRRCEAAMRAGLPEVPAAVVSSQKTQALDAVMENMARLDLTVVERAMAYKRLMSEGWSMTKVAEVVGMYRETISRQLRLLKLPQPVLQLNIDRKLGEGHLLELMPLHDAGYSDYLIILTAQRAARERYTSRAIRLAVNAYLEAARAPQEGEKPPALTPPPPPPGKKPRTAAVPPREKGAALVQRIERLRDALARCAEAAEGMDSQKACRTVRAICAEALSQNVKIRP